MNPSICVMKNQFALLLRPLHLWNCFILTRTEEKGLNSFTFHNLCLTIAFVTLHPIPVEKSGVLRCQSHAEVRCGEAFGS